MKLQLAQDVLDVIVDRSGANGEPGGDFIRAKPLREHFENLHFSTTQAMDELIGVCRRSSGVGLPRPAGAVDLSHEMQQRASPASRCGNDEGEQIDRHRPTLPCEEGDMMHGIETSRTHLALNRTVASAKRRPIPGSKTGQFPAGNTPHGGGIAHQKGRRGLVTETHRAGLVRRDDGVSAMLKG